MVTIIFVSSSNSCWSQMAEAWARAVGGAEVDVFSCGEKPAKRIVEHVNTVMEEAGITMDDQYPKGPEAVPNIEYDAVVSMEEIHVCPSIRGRQRIEWELPEPKDLSIDSLRLVRDEIGHHVRVLIHALVPASTTE